MRNLIVFGRAFYPFRYTFGTKGQLISDIFEYSQRLQGSGHLQQQVVRDYIELTQQSFLQKTNNGTDYEFMLMILPTLQNQSAIRQYLPSLYPYTCFMSPKQLHLFLQYVIIARPTNKPPLAKPMPLLNCQSLLLLLGEVYSADSLVEWLGEAANYTGDKPYTVIAGMLSIVNGLKIKKHSNYQKTIQKCHKMISNVYLSSTPEEQVDLLILSLELDQELGEQLLQITNFSEETLMELNWQKGLLLFLNLSKHLNRKGDQKRWKDLQQNLCWLVTDANWEQVMKLSSLVECWNVLKDQELKKFWVPFKDKLCSHTRKINLQPLDNSQLISILSTMEHHLIDNRKLLGKLLVAFSERFDDLTPQQTIQLTRCLVTYVRQCEDYLVSLRAHTLKRKFRFSPNQLQSLNHTYQRVRVLFPDRL